jgi:hypothetical protein
MHNEEMKYIWIFGLIYRRNQFIWCIIWVKLDVIHLNASKAVDE